MSNLNVEALARMLAWDECFSASLEGYPWDENNPQDVEHFYPTSLRKARIYANILEGK